MKSYPVLLKALLAFSSIGVVATGVLIGLAPDIGLSSLGLPIDTPLETKLFLVGAHLAWGASKVNAILSGPKALGRYYRLTFPAVVFWFVSAFQSGDPSAYGLPALMSVVYPYLGFVHGFDQYVGRKKD